MRREDGSWGRAVTAELGRWQSWSQEGPSAGSAVTAPRCHCRQDTSKDEALQGFLELVFVFPFVVIVSLSPFLLGFSVLLHLLPVLSKTNWEAVNISWSCVF